MEDKEDFLSVAGRLGWDLPAALNYNKTEISPGDIEDIKLELTGENDERDWHWIVSLKDKRFAYIAGGCDYTGWDCQSYCEVHFADLFIEAISLAPLEERRLFEEMVKAGETTRPAPGRVW